MISRPQVREVSFTMCNGAVAPPDLPGEVLFRRQRARQWQVLLRMAAEDCLAALRANPASRISRSAAPSLEEIFVAYMQQGREAVAGHPAGEEAKP